MASAYWEKRVLDSESKAQRLAAKASKRQKKIYNDAYKAMAQELNALYTKIFELGQIPTRTELWKIQKFIDMQGTIDKVFNELGEKQLSIVESCLLDVFDYTIDALKLEKTNAAFNLVSRQQALQVLNENWSGNTYSNRIWGVNGKIKERVKNDITDMVIKGKSPTDIKAAIMAEFGVGFSYADRLIRTEASHIYNEAAKHTYKDAGVEEVEVIRESDCCPDCALLVDKYPLAQVPKLPLHPNCRCCYVPVVEIPKVEADIPDWEDFPF